MLCAIAYYSGDLQQAIRLAEWMKKLGPYPGHRLLVARDISADLKPFADVGFDSVEEIVIRDDVWKKWAESPNNAFRKVAKHIQYTMPEPWLWLESDCAPIRAGWLDAIQAEYRAKGKPFMGDFVPGVGGSPDHCSGIAVYPGMLTDYAGNATMAMEYPWDLEAADQIRPHAHFTELIKHNWRPPEFNSREEMQAEIPPECVLYHKDKSGALLRLLNGTDDAVTAERPAPAVETSKPTCAIEGCDIPIYAKGVCRMHYARHDRLGSYDLPPKPTVQEKLMANRNIDDNGCWLWTAGGFSSGYGEINISTPDDMRDAARKGRLPRGESSTQSKLTEAEVLQMRAEYADGIPQAILAERYNCSQSNVSFVVSERTWRHLLGAQEQQIEPWVSPLESEQEIKRLCAELRRFCVGPVRTGIVRRELAVAKVTPPISGKKRRRK